MTDDFDASSLASLNTDIQWRKVGGYYGEFLAPGADGARIRYIQTVVDLGSSGTASSQLASDIKPVREVFEVSQMNFEELLQRDIDDFRVATGIIPYLSDPTNASRVRFMPPILVAVMPYGDKKIERTMPAKETGGEGVHKWGSVARLERIHQDDKPTPLATLSYNPESSRLVVLDGQHRAMAVLAIKREKQNSWQGSEHQRFYEEVGRGLAGISDEALQNIQLPVCLMLIDDTVGDINLIDACRRLFLDVNRTAKPPTTARMRLLDDVDLRSVFARRVLSQMRVPGSRPSDYGTAVHFFEYDNPKDTPRPTREIAYSSIEILWSMIRWSMFESDDYQTNLTKKAGPSRPGKNFDRAITLIGLDDEFAVSELEQLGVPSVTKLVASEQTLERPIIDRIADRFEETMGSRMKSLFKDLLPFRCHAQAVAKLAGQKASSREGVGAIAFGALFDGAGTYWTLRDFHTTRAQRRKEGEELAPLDVESAYELIHDQWLTDVERWRATPPLVETAVDTVSDSDQELARRAFDVFRTQAFQVGVFMAFCHLAQRMNSWDGYDTWLRIWNEGLRRKVNNHRRALWAYSSNYVEMGSDGVEVPTGFMAVSTSRLQVSDWVWFRYLAFEQMVATQDDSYEGASEVQQAASIGRTEFLRYLGREIDGVAKKDGVKLTDSARRNRVVDHAVRSIGKPYGLAKEGLRELYSSLSDEPQDESDESSPVGEEGDEV